MKKISCIAISLLMILSLASCGQTPSSPAPATTPSSSETVPSSSTAPAESAGSDKAYDGEAVNLFIRMRSEANAAGLQELIDYIKEQSGIEVNLIAAPTNYSDFVTKITASLSSDDDTYDLIHIDEFSIKNFAGAGFLEPITDVMEPVAQHYPQVIMESISKYENDYYTMPIDLNMMYFYVNQKMLDEKGVKAPTTKEEFVEVAKKLTEGDVYGYGAAWGKGGQLYNDVYRFVYLFGGDMLDWENPQNKEALQFMYDLLYTHKVTPVAVLGDVYDPLNQKMINGMYGMANNWASLGLVVPDDKWGTEIVVAPMPTFETNKTISAGWHIGINAFSNHIPAAKEVVKLWSSKEGQFFNLKYEGASYDEVLAMPEAVELNRLGKALSEYVAAGSPTPRVPIDRNSELQEIVETYAGSYLSNQITLDECMSQAAPQIKALVG